MSFHCTYLLFITCALTTNVAAQGIGGRWEGDSPVIASDDTSDIAPEDASTLTPDDTSIVFSQGTSVIRLTHQSSELLSSVDPPWHFPISYVPRDWVRSVMLIPRPTSLRTLSGVGLATAGLLVIDNVTRRWNQGLTENSPALRHAAWTAVHFGDGRYHLAISGAMMAYGLTLDDRRALRTGGQVFESLLASGIVVQVLKHVTGRESPAANTGIRGRIRPLPSLSAYDRQQAKYYAFPSGHLTTAMSTVTVLAENYPEAGWIRPAGYAVVGVLGTSLVNVGYHWYSDLPFGILMGYTFGMLAAHPAWIGEETGEYSHLYLGPAAVGRTAGLQVAWVF